MTDEESRDRRFVELLSRTPDLGAKAWHAMDSRFSGTDGCLYARRVLDRELGAGPDGAAEWVYREASAILRSRGHHVEGHALRLVADTSSALAAASAEWLGRYLARPVTASERDSLRLIGNGTVRPAALPGGIKGGLGADGALYTPASVTAGGGTPAPAVIVTTHAGTAEVVTGFAHEYDQADWLADRTAPALPDGAPPSAAFPLQSCSDGPDCRTTREERVLAWLLGSEPGDGDLRLHPAERFTTCTRAEIYLAWRDAGGLTGTPPTVDETREALARRLLRAPAWAAPLTGGPFGHLALAYYDRITVTPVSVLEGKAAARAIAREDDEAASSARASAPRGRRVPFPRQAPWPGAWPPHQPGPDGPSPRL